MLNGFDSGGMQFTVRRGSWATIVLEIVELLRERQISQKLNQTKYI